ncbi:testis-expressed protein 38 isoform X1 [Sminthopsis crassicaudata]|uniref:testis-expressed protein 38 isoform X1 n=1 Tax=Sminthopsis crassicaudata TaxID=9301 RepID=UPI003D69A3B8
MFRFRSLATWRSNNAGVLILLEEAGQRAFPGEPRRLPGTTSPLPSWTPAESGRASPVVRREEQAQEWVEVMQAATFTYSPLLYWINKRRQYGMNTGVKVDLPVASPKPEVPKPPTSIPEGKSDAPRARFLMCPASAPPLVCYSTPAPHNPVFQEVAFAPSLGNVPPMVNHSASYPFAACPQRNVQFHSLPALAHRDCCFNPKGLAYEL